MTRCRPRSPQRAGFTLVELMVSLAIGALLLIGLIQVFSSARTAYQLSEGLARVQENGRFAIDFLQRDIRLGGHFGCINDQAHLQNGVGSFNLLFAPVRTPAGYDALADERLHFHISVQGYEYAGTGPDDAFAFAETPVPVANLANWTPNLPASLNLAGRVLPGSDVLVLRYLAAEGIPLVNFTPVQVDFDPARWDILRGPQVNPGLLALADCVNVLLFQPSAVDSAAGTILIPPVPAGLNARAFGGADQFAPGQAFIHRAESMAYYVGIGAGGLPSLFRMRYLSVPGGGGLALQPEELVEGVESLQLLYGVDLQNNPAQLPTGYIQNLATADAVGAAANWRRVGAVKIGLLLRAPEPSAAAQSDAPQRVLGLTANVPEDGRMRTVYESTVAMRNRLFGN